MGQRFPLDVFTWDIWPPRLLKLYQLRFKDFGLICFGSYMSRFFHGRVVSTSVNGFTYSLSLVLGQLLMKTNGVGTNSSASYGGYCPI